ncbi:hypothetical protein HPB48_020746 [Haemaphysalis longicornis]|uniref:Sequestosome 1 n=1 Tax=Haemaphysalis longicornis TaxID=44386 RepID=A0A9J6H313_HAELO|nr:hypothetical protein HPB48_020746 [Haemaphysalis longicornis]
MNTPPPPNWSGRPTGPQFQQYQVRLLDNMTVTIKAYLLGTPEIRRFVFEDLREYKTLHMRIRAAFPVLAGKDFTLSWKDAEGDQIIMSTDPELVQAVQNMKDGLLRIFVTVIGVPKPEPEPLGASGDGSAKVHAGVLCDVCDQEIRGARYKCLQCEDYDLCEVCHAKKTHEQHDMLKLVNPGIRPLWSFPGWKRLWRHCGHHRRGGRGGGGWGARGPMPPPEPEPASPQQYHDLLRNIGGTVANFLEPFGITVDVLNDMGTNTGGPARGQAKKDSATEPMDTSHPQPEPANAQQVLGPVVDIGAGNLICGQETSKDRCVACEIPVVGSYSGADRVSPVCTQDSEVYPGWTLLNALRDSFVSSEEGNLPPPMRPQASAQPATVQPPTAPPAATQQSRTDSPVDTALAQMLAMGFNNEGGWLRQLLEVKQGDIGAVLESLHPSRQM